MVKLGGGHRYFYLTNLQGDITAIVSVNGNTVVRYTYDAWGNVLSIEGTRKDNLGKLNPLRYRGYVYDEETRLYYLQSRYYDPQIGRFINSDVYACTGQGLLGNNMFAYCNNNPVTRKDSEGTAVETVFDIISLGTSIVEVAVNPGDPWAWIALIGDAADAVIPFVGGIGEAARAINAAVEVADDIYDAGKAVDRIDDTSDAYKVMSEGLCFVAGTAVLTQDGATVIESICPGDMVWAWDEETGDVALKEVVETYVNKTDELVHVLVNGEEIITTPTHPFYSPAKGWVEAVHLRSGDILVLFNGKFVVVEEVQHELLEVPVIVYNLQVEDYHTYYVTNAGVLVHNSCNHHSHWNSERRKYWKNTAESAVLNQDYGAYVATNTNIKRMRKGLAPIGWDNYSVQLHHWSGIANDFYNYSPVSRTLHQQIHMAK